MRKSLSTPVCLTVLLLTGAVAHAQEARKLQVLESVPLESISHVKGAPFSADAITEFTQVLGDGNRIERRHLSSIARDGEGRTRREEDVVLIGALTTAGAMPRLVTIDDPLARTSYTLDDDLRVAHRNPLTVKRLTASVLVGPAPARQAAETVVTDVLGRRSIEGVVAEGMRTTTTIPAGAIGNLAPIEIVSERWFSPDLQMPVLITRRDPRSGDTVYRLVNVQRAEPPAHLFMVPPGYEVREGKLGTWKMVETAKAKKATAARGKIPAQRNK